MASRDARRLVIRSGGQTGVDRAGLDAAIACGLPYVGYVPKGGRCEDGIDLLGAYPDLVEMKTANYAARTVANVKASDATLIIKRARQPMGPGTAMTVRAAEQAGKPCLVLDRRSVRTVLDWLADIDADPLDLNIAGARESGSPGIYADALDFLITLFTAITEVPALPTEIAVKRSRWGEDPVAEHQVKIDRSSPLGNPYPMGRDESKRDLVCDQFADYLTECLDTANPDAVVHVHGVTVDKARRQRVRDAMNDLARLARTHERLELYCWCAPKRCHGDEIKRRLEAKLAARDKRESDDG